MTMTYFKHYITEKGKIGIYRSLFQSRVDISIAKSTR